MSNFNLSVGVTDAFMQAVQADGEVELVHRAEPGIAQKEAGAYAVTPAEGRPTGSTASCPRACCGTRSCAPPTTMPSPACLFLDRINDDNNLQYCETIATHESLRHG